MERIIVEKKDDPSKPQIATSVTNDRMAQFAIREWGMHRYGNMDDCIFVKTDDLFSPDRQQQVAQTQQIVYEKALHRGRTQASDQEQYEKELLVMGIKSRLSNIDIVIQENN
jgi:hypothetical protein